jgi:hypothetical protein
MRVRWFGEPWGISGRAPICEDEYHIATPVGTKCLECTKLIGERDQGVVTACSPGIWGSWVLTIVVHPDDVSLAYGVDYPGTEVQVCSYHLHCWLKEVVGGVMSEKILARMEYRVGDDEIVPVQSPGLEEDATPGRGWGTEKVNLDDLVVDPQYQRPLDMDKVDRLVKEWQHDDDA